MTIDSPKLRIVRDLPLADRTLASLLRLYGQRHGEKPVLQIGGQFYAAADLAGRGEQVAGFLRRRGIGPGDRVAMICGNRIELVECLLGCAMAGAILVPFNIAARGQQLAHMLENSGSVLLLIEPEYRASLDTTRGFIASLPETIELEASPPWAVAGHSTAPADTTASSGSDIGAILYTSGTTGPSKGVLCSHAQLTWFGAHSAELLQLEEEDVLLTTLPLCHVNALSSLYQALICGGTLIVEQRFSVSRFTAVLAESRATVTYLLGAMVPMALSAAATDDDRAHRVRLALAPGVLDDQAEMFTARFGIPLLNGYGSTETSFVIGTHIADRRPGSMGTIRPGFSARVVDENDEVVATGAVGELVLRADEPFSMAAGYHAMPEATIAAWRNLWFHTGDRVTCDADGHFWFVDRAKDAIRRRGENISSFEVEQVLMTHPAVKQVAVYPVKAELGEDEVMAAIVLSEGGNLEPVDLLDFCAGKMSYFSVPRFVLVIEMLPVTHNGKIAKGVLRDLGVTPETWDRDAHGYEVLR